MIKLAIIGLGNIGSAVLKNLSESDEGIKIAALCDHREPSPELQKIIETGDIPFVRKIEALPSFSPDYVLEAANQEVVEEYTLFFLEKGISLIIMSVGGLCRDDLYQKVVSLCSPEGPRMIIPSGAIGGVDILKAASMGRIERVHLRTSKPPNNLRSKAGGSAVPRGPHRLYFGPAGKAALLFPRNVNVAMTLALAGIGPQKTTVEIIADPSLEKNTHQLFIEGEFGSAEIILRNDPSPANPRTSHLAILSVLQTLKNLQSGLVIGS